ncbi:MAG: hypothetical protein LUQ07_00445 [Methanospirillum sp.]|nr:hypothetical protein [Methanospirillum sp.]
MGIYTSFTAAAENLVQGYKNRCSGKLKPDQSISPVILLLFARLEKNAEISPPLPDQEPSSGMVFSHLEDKMGHIVECANREYTIPPPEQPHMSLLPGCRVMMEVIMTIKPHGTKACSTWPIKYRSGNIPYCLGFKGLLFVEKL